VRNDEFQSISYLLDFCTKLENLTRLFKSILYDEVSLIINSSHIISIVYVKFDFSNTIILGESK